VVCWQLTLCDPHLSALEVRFSRRCAIQIDVYLQGQGQGQGPDTQGQAPGRGLGQLWGIVPTGLFLPVGNASLRYTVNNK